MMGIMERRLFPLVKDINAHFDDVKPFVSVQSLSFPLKDVLGIKNLDSKCTANKAVYHKDA